MSQSIYHIEIPVHVEFEDVDAYKIVHHTKLIAFLERARVRFFRKYGIDVITGDYSIVLHKLNIRFAATAKFQDELTVEASLDSADESRIRMNYKIRRNRSLIVKAKSELACIDMNTQSITLFPKPLLEQFRQNT
ncbi:MAG: thioesterase family protein [Calditrichaceae bacterium]